MNLTVQAQDTVLTVVNDSSNLSKKVLDYEGYLITIYELKYTPRDSNYIVYFDSLMNKKALEFFCQNDTCYNYQYYNSGVLKQKTKYYPKIVDSSTPIDIIYFAQELYCENEQLISLVNNKDKESVSYYCNGVIAEKFSYCDGWLFVCGEYTSYYKNKTTKEMGNYEQGIKVGLWKYYSEKNKLMKEEIWDKGVLKETKEYDDEGNLIKN